MERVNNPFAVQQQQPERQQALVETESQRAIQEVQAALIIAKRFPRDERVAMDRILTACTRPGLAEKAVYQYAKGGTAIDGPSIRLAEAIAQNWGNMQFGIRELEQRDGESTVEAFAWDVETNTRQTKTFQVGHMRHTKRGSYRLEDPREIYESVANQGARRLRACILGIIPGDVIESAVKQCEVTMATHEQVTPDRIKAMIGAFSEFGVSKEQIEARIQRRMDAITPALMGSLRKIYNSLKDGMSDANEWFTVETRSEAKSNGKSRSESLAEQLKSEKPAATAQDKPQEAFEAANADIDTCDAPQAAKRRKPAQQKTTTTEEITRALQVPLGLAVSFFSAFAEDNEYHIDPVSATGGGFSDWPEDRRAEIVRDAKLWADRIKDWVDADASDK